MRSVEGFFPLWGKWRLDGALGNNGENSPFLGAGSFGEVWRVYCEDETGRDYAAVKHISVPRDENEVNALIVEGIIRSEASRESYYNHEKQQLMKEIATMRSLRGYTNIVSYEDEMMFPKPDGIGYDLFLRMELLTPLDKFSTAMSKEQIIKLGIDMYLSESKGTCRKGKLNVQEAKVTFIRKNGKRAPTVRKCACRTARGMVRKMRMTVQEAKVTVH